MIVWGRDQIALQIIRLNTLVDVLRVSKAPTSGELLPIDKKNCKHLHTERGGISSELILENKILKLNIMMKNHKIFRFLSGCTNGLPALSWPLKHE